MTPWLVIVTFLFPGMRPMEWTEYCASDLCIAAISDAAALDPHVIKFRVLQPGDIEAYPGSSVLKPRAEWRKA